MAIRCAPGTGLYNARVPRPRNRAKGALDRKEAKGLAEQVLTLEERLKAASDFKEKSDLEFQLARVAAKLLDQCSPEARTVISVNRNLRSLAGVDQPRTVAIQPAVSAAIRHITAVAPEWLVWREFQTLRMQQDHDDPVTEKKGDSSSSPARN